MKCIAITTAIAIAFAAPAFAADGRAAGFGGGSGNSEFDNLNGTMTGNVIKGLANNTSDSSCVCSRGVDANSPGVTVRKGGPKNSELDRALMSNRRANKAGLGKTVSRNGTTTTIGGQMYNNKTGAKVNRTRSNKPNHRR